MIFIKKHACFCNTANLKVSGEKVWDIYVKLIQNRDLTFSEHKYKLLILNGIMSKFVFSVYMKKKEELKPFLDYNEQNSDYQFFQYFKLLKSEIGNWKR